MKKINYAKITSISGRVYVFKITGIKDVIINDETIDIRPNSPYSPYGEIEDDYLQNPVSSILFKKNIELIQFLEEIED